MKQIKKNLLILGFVLSSLTIAKFANAGGIMITPSRVDLSEKNTSQEVKLINKGNETTTYRITFQHLRMNKNGTYEEIKETAQGKEQFADDLVAFSPKQVTLKPGEVQTVRLMFKKSANLNDGEYRSHLLLREEASADFGKNVEQPKKDGGKKTISVVLKPLFGTSIPVVVTKGNVSGKAEIKEAAVKSRKAVNVRLARSGNASVFGDLIVTLTDKSGKKSEIGTLNNIAVFYPYDEREVSIALNKDVKASDGTLEVNYYGKTKDYATDKNKVLAKKTVNN